jgi:hypothetical protein
MREHHQSLERPITLRLSAAVREAVEREAERDRRPLAAMIRIAVEDWIGQRQSVAGGSP